MEIFHLGDDENIRIGGDSSDRELNIVREGDSITVDAVEEAMDSVQEFVEEKLLRFGCEKHDLQRIRLVVEEIFVNIYSYAYDGGDGRAKISCRVSEKDDTAIICFIDTGKPFNPLTRAPADTSGKQFIERAGGFGIHIVREVMDQESYEYRDGKNVLTLEKKLKRKEKQ